MSGKLCNEFLGCDLEACPSYDNTEDDKCWLIAGTWCTDPVTKDNRPKSIAEKKAQCFGSCRYHEYRVNLGA